MKPHPVWGSLKTPVKFRIPTSENLLPVRLDIETDGHRFRDSFTWNPSDPDSEVVVFAKRTVKDLKLPPAFVTLIAQSIQSQLTEFRSLEGQDMYTGEKIVPIKLDLRVNHTLIKDQFLWDLNNFESDPEEFAKIFCRDLGIEDPEVGPAVAFAIREQLCEGVVSAKETRISKKGRRGAEHVPLRLHVLFPVSRKAQREVNTIAIDDCPRPSIFRLISQLFFSIYKNIKMAKGEDVSFFKKHWEGYKEFWGERFSFLDNYSRFIRRHEPLPSWSQSDVDEFIASDPVNGPILKTACEAVKFGAVGSAIGAVSTAGIAWKYSKSPHGAALSFAAGAVFGWTFGQEIANHWLQLYRLDTMAAQVKFLDWWESKMAGRS